MLEHNQEGAFGLVLNRPSDTEVAAVLPAWAGSVMWPTCVFVGGPVQPDAVIALALAPGSVEPTEAFAPVLGRLGTVDVGRSPAEVPPMRCLRMFAGYAGWGARQLEAELGAHA